MKVKVELQAYLEGYAPNGRAVFEYEIPEGTRVIDLVRQLGVPEELASIIVVGNASVDLAHPLQEADQVTLIPPLAGG